MPPAHDKPDRSYLKPYEDATRQMGVGFEAQLWMSREAQSVRFDILDELGRFGDRVVADLGCGIGDLAIYLHDKYANRPPGGQPPRAGFPRSLIGIEGVAKLAEHARERLRSAGVERFMIDRGDFVAYESLPKLLIEEAGVEVFIFSGSLNTLPMGRAQEILARFWHELEAGGRGTLIFNFLSDRHDKDRTPANPPAVRFDPVEMLEWSLSRTPLVTLRHEYLRGHDATIVMDVAANSG